MVDARWIRRSGEHAWQVSVKVQPGAKRSEVAGADAERLRIRIMAPAVDNKANKELVVFLAGILGIKPGGIRLIRGGMSRQKTLLVTSAAEPDWEALRPGNPAAAQSEQCR